MARQRVRAGICRRFDSGALNHRRDATALLAQALRREAAKMRALIADDDASTRHLLWRLLTDWGHSVVIAADADEAWAVLQEPSLPQLVILDRGLAKGGGLGLCRLIRDFNLRAEMHVIVAMSVVDSHGVVSAFEAGADDLIAKPFNLDELRRRVSTGCDELTSRLEALGRFEHDHDGHRRRGTPAGGARLLAGERQHTVLARLGEQASAGVGLRDFVRAAVTEVAQVMAADSVQIVDRSPDTLVPFVRAEATSAAVPRAQLPARLSFAEYRDHEIAVRIGPDKPLASSLVVRLLPPRRVHPVEAEFVTSVAQLVHLVSEREQLEAQVRQAQKMSTFGQLAGGIAHDFNNVLAVIGTVAATMDADAGGVAIQREEIDLICQAVERGRGLARQLLSFGRTPSELPGLIDLNQTVFQARAMLERLLLGRVAIATELDPRPLMVRADRGELEQVLVNLVLNARDASPIGSLVVIRTGHTIFHGNGIGLASFSVVDAGAGMDESIRVRIFEPFFTTKPPGQGTGLGLSTVKEIVRRAEGKIKVDSKPGQGTAITVFWPCAQAACCEGVVVNPEPRNGAAA